MAQTTGTGVATVGIVITDGTAGAAVGGGYGGGLFIGRREVALEGVRALEDAVKGDGEEDSDEKP